MKIKKGQFKSTDQGPVRKSLRSPWLLLCLSAACLIFGIWSNIEAETTENENYNLERTDLEISTEGAENADEGSEAVEIEKIQDGEVDTASVLDDLAEGDRSESDSLKSSLALGSSAKTSFKSYLDPEMSEIWESNIEGDLKDSENLESEPEEIAQNSEISESGSMIQKTSSESHIEQNRGIKTYFWAAASWVARKFFWGKRNAAEIWLAVREYVAKLASALRENIFGPDGTHETVIEEKQSQLPAPDKIAELEDKREKKSKQQDGEWEDVKSGGSQNSDLKDDENEGNEEKETEGWAGKGKGERETKSKSEEVLYWNDPSHPMESMFNDFIAMGDYEIAGDLPTRKQRYASNVVNEDLEIREEHQQDEENGSCSGVEEEPEEEIKESRVQGKEEEMKRDMENGGGDKGIADKQGNDKIEEGEAGERETEPDQGIEDDFRSGGLEDFTEPEAGSETETEPEPEPEKETSAEKSEQAVETENEKSDLQISELQQDIQSEQDKSQEQDKSPKQEENQEQESQGNDPVSNLNESDIPENDNINETETSNDDAQPDSTHKTRNEDNYLNGIFFI